MKFTSEFNRENLNDFFSTNKDFIFPVLAIGISILLFLFFVFPQILSFPAKKGEADQESVRLNKIQAAYDLLSQTDASVVDTNLKAAQKTLPDKKDFESVLGAISLSASNTNTQIKSYSFSEGGVVSEKYPTLSFEIETFGQIQDAVNFIDELYKTYPLSDVNSLISSENVSKMQVDFYYRAFPPITLEDRITVSNTTSEERAALDKVSGWNDSATANLAVPEASVSSGTPF